jgi:hypothetical protein
LFDNRGYYFRKGKDQFDSISEFLPNSVKDFMEVDNFMQEIEDLNKNCSNLKSFNNRLFQKFNAFKILKFLNFTHEKYYQMTDLQDQIKRLKNA